MTNSPRFPQANGEAERAVEIAKGFLRKAEDPYLALLAYRSTPNPTGYSPAQLLMGRQLRTTVPTTTAALRPQTPDATQLQQLDRKSKEQQAKYFNKHHRTREQPSRQVGEEVWVPDPCSRATVTEVHPFRSYSLLLQNGYTIRRNSHTLRSYQPQQQNQRQHDLTDGDLLSQQQLRVHVRNEPSPAAIHRSPIARQQPAIAIRQPGLPYVTRLGRNSRPPQRLN